MNNSNTILCFSVVTSRMFAEQAAAFRETTGCRVGRAGEVYKCIAGSCRNPRQSIKLTLFSLVSCTVFFPVSNSLSGRNYW